MCGGQSGHSLDAGAGVPLERPQGCVSALGHQQRQGHSGLGEVGNGEVSSWYRVRSGLRSSLSNGSASC
jgi:hypothetical protein